VSRKTLCERVAGLLAEATGAKVDPDEIRPVYGGWKKLDVYRWEVYIEVEPGVFVFVGSWSTMAACARYGITTSEDSLGSLEVFAKDPLFSGAEGVERRSR
jgi:hypothetical protein